MIKQLRQSSLKSFLTCPAQFYERYVLELPEVFSPVLDLGTHYHKEVERYHLGQDHDQKLIEPYIQAVKPVEGELIEHQFEYVMKHPILGTELDIPFTGTIDRVVPNEFLADLKTSSTSWSQTKADKTMPDFSGWFPEMSGLQATAYCYYWWQEHGELLPFDFVIFRKDIKKNGDKYPVKSVRTYRTLEDFAHFYDLCEKVIYDIKHEKDWSCQCQNQEHKIAGINA